MTQEDTFESYPLSPLQEGMLFHALARLGKGVDIEQIIVTLHEPVDTQALEKAWNLLLARHEVLRSRFEWEGLPEPRHVVVPSVSLKLSVFDLHTMPPEARESSFADYLQKDRERDFDMSRAPLMRLALFEFGPAEYRLLWSFHHILLDGRSFPLLIEELFKAYGAVLEGRRIEADCPRPFKDYVRWVRERDLTEDRRFWTDYLAGFASPTPLVVDRALSAGQRTLGSQGAVEARVPKELCTKLRSVAQAYGLSMNTFLEAAWALVLHRYSGEEDLVYGTTRSCRRGSLPGAERMIGLLINTIPVRVQVREDARVADWLQGVRRLHRTLREHIHAPLYKIHEWSEISGAHPLFESLVVFEKYSLQSHLRAKGGAWLEREFTYLGRTNYPLSILGYDGEEMQLRIEYDKDRFADDTVQRMIGHIQTVLSHIPECLDRPVSDVPILTEAERHQLLVEWNDTTAAYPQDVCLHELFEAQAGRTPDAVAVVFEGSSLTYRELDCRANQLARRLRALGVGPEVLVGLYMERSLEMVVGIYGVLKAGGAYVPLDPEYPRERLAYMLKDTAAPVILTQERLAKELPWPHARLLCIDPSGWRAISNEETGNLGIDVKPENAAYVIYTSGSTGTPKGVINEHRGIVNRLLWMQDEYRLTGVDRVLQKTPFSFDVSVWEFFWPLLCGAGLVVARPEGHKDAGYLIDTINREGITTLHFVPSMLQIFLQHPAVATCRGLRRVICSGEALPHEVQEAFFDSLPHVELHNLYGPTEAAVDVTYWRCRRDAPYSFVPIGRPVANTRIYILDTQMRPVPIGVSGELHIGGIQVARGYLNRPELTAERFVPDPFTSASGARLYKTGDLCRYLPDGAIEYLGRNDFQVKIRGLRIEIGEIECVLCRHPEVQQAVVTVREDVPGDKRLVAYITPKGDTPPPAALLIEYLKNRLPEYMVPNAFVTMERFPLTPNGKIDRRALPPPPTSRPELESTYVPPQTQIEKTIAAIWQEVLDVEQVGVDDNFFDLGGHSLRMAKVHARLCEALNTPLSMLELFRYPTIRSLALYLGRGGRDAAGLEEDAAQAQKLKQGRQRLQRHLRQRKQA